MNRYRRGYEDNPGMEMMGMANMFAGSVQRGQQIEQGRMALEDAKGVNAAYEHIANKVGQTGDISALDGDPIMSTRYGTIAAGKFLGQRAQSETSRLQMLKNMAASDDEYYRNTFRPLAFAADEAFKAGDLQKFGAITNELSAKAPMPYKTQLQEDGSFKLFFRSDKEGGWTDTGQKLSAQDVMQEIGGIIGGEQKVLAGANMQEMVTNPRFLAASARYRMGTIMGNAKAMEDTSKWIPMQKGNQLVWAIPQNRHDDYSSAPSYKIVDDSGKMGGMVTSLDQLVESGFVRADAKAKLDKLQRVGRGGTRNGKPPTVAQLTAAENHAMKVIMEEEGVQKSAGQYVDADGEPVGAQFITELRQKARSAAREAYGLQPKQGANTAPANDPLGLGLGGKEYAGSSNPMDTERRLSEALKSAPEIQKRLALSF